MPPIWKNRLKKHWYSVASLILGTLFSLSCLGFNEPFYAVLTIYVSLTFSTYSFWIERREVEIVSEAQLLSYLKHRHYEALDNVISQNKLKEIVKISSELEKSIFELSPRQMETYTSSAIKSIIKLNSQKTYYATHIVNDEHYLNIWRKDSLLDNERDLFVGAQKELLNNNGELIRIFIFKQNFLKNHKQQCIDMLEKHALYYEGTETPVTTLTYIATSRDRGLTNDFTIVGNEVAFEWARSLDDDDYGDGTCFVDKEVIKSYAEKFNDFKSRSQTVTNFINRLNNI